MKLKKKLLNAIMSVSLLGGIVAAPAAAQTDYTVTFSRGQFQIVQSDRYDGHCPNSGGSAYTPVGYPVGQAPYSECDAQPTFSECDTQSSYGGQGSHPADNYQPAQALSFGQQVLHLTNQARAQYGLAPLQAHPSLRIAATSHSQEMLALDYFSHTSPTAGRSGPSDRVRQAGASPNYIAENIFQASGHDASVVADLAVQSWLQSPGHRRNMLSPQATHIGIGFVELNGTVSVTQVFGAGL